MVKPNPGDKPSLLTHSDFFFLILLTISHYAHYANTLYSPWKRGWHRSRTVSASFGFAMPNDSWGSWVPACRTGTITFFARFFKRTKYEGGVERETRATSEGVCHASVSRPPRSSHKKKRHHLRPANLSVIEHHNVTVQHQREHSG